VEKGCSKVIETFIPLHGAGTHYFTGSTEYYDMLWGPFFPGAIHGITLLISDTIIIDAFWRESVDPGVWEDLVTCSVINELIQRNIIQEINIRKELNPNQFRQELGVGLAESMKFWIRHNRAALPKRLIEETHDNPYEALQLLKTGRVPESLRVLVRGLDISLTGIYTSIVAGRICSRIHDPQGYLRSYNCLVHSNCRKSVDEENVDRIVAICSESLPEIPIFLSKENEPTVPDPPAAAEGFTLQDHPMCDKDKTMKNLEKILSVRDSGACKDLRATYRSTLERVMKAKAELSFYVEKEDFHKQWALARAEMHKHLAISKKFEQWTDILTIPAFVASIFLPAAGAIPFVSWAATKVTSGLATRKVLIEYPWLSLAEQMGDLGLELKKSFLRDRVIDN